MGEDRATVARIEAAVGHPVDAQFRTVATELAHGFVQGFVGRGKHDAAQASGLGGATLGVFDRNARYLDLQAYGHQRHGQRTGLHLFLTTGQGLACKTAVPGRDLDFFATVARLHRQPLGHKPQPPRHTDDTGAQQVGLVFDK